MPKMKTKKSAKKRFKVTGTGKIKRFSQNHRHHLTQKAPNRKRRLRKATLVAKSHERMVKRMLCI